MVWPGPLVPRYAIAPGCHGHLPRAQGVPKHCSPADRRPAFRNTNDTTRSGTVGSEKLCVRPRLRDRPARPGLSKGEYTMPPRASLWQQPVDKTSSRRSRFCNHRRGLVSDFGGVHGPCCDQPRFSCETVALPSLERWCCSSANTGCAGRLCILLPLGLPPPFLSQQRIPSRRFQRHAGATPWCTSGATTDGQGGHCSSDTETAGPTAAAAGT